MLLVRKEVDGLNVYEEEQPARIAQFVSSGMKNLKGDIFKLGRFLGFAFPLTDLTPAERMGWEDNTPAPVKPAEGVRFEPAVRDRLGGEPVLLSTVGWPAGTTLVSRPDFAWRADAVQDERPDSERPDFARPGALPELRPERRERLVPEDREGARRRARQVPLRARRPHADRTSASCASSSTPTAR